MSKLSASLLVLVMALATLVVLPGPNQGQALGTNDIYVPVVSGGIPVSGATVTLTNVHTGEVIQATPSGGLYRAVGAPSGYYRVDVVAAAYYDAVDVRGFKFLGTTSYTVSPQIQLTKFPTAAYSWNVTVVNAVAPHWAIQGARASFYDNAAREKVALDTGPTGIEGYTTVVMFPTISPSMYLTVQADGFETNATAQTVSNSRSITVWLEPAGVISGLVTNSDSSKPATSGVVAYALDDDTSQPWIKRLLKSEGLSPYFVFNAKVGNTYTVCVDAPGLAANVTQIVATGAVQYLTFNLDNQTQRTEQVDMTLAAGYGSFSYSLATVLSYDDAIPGMNYSDIGSLRMQIDLNGFEVPADGSLSVTEIGRFTSKLTGYGVAHPTSGRLLTINNTLYSSGVPTFGFLTGLGTGSVMSTDGVSYSYTSTYTAVGSVDASAPDYMMNATAMLDSSAVHHVNSITLPSQYEAVQNSTGGHVNVTGYHPTVMLSSKQGSSVTELVQVWIEKSQKPTVKGSIQVLPSAVYAVKVNDTVVKYVVKVGANATFDAKDSVDPNGNPLTYTWDFADTTAPVTTMNKTVVHNFASASALRHVVLNVSDVSGLWNVTELNVTCDGLAPTPVITFLNKTVNATDNSITVNQREGFVLNATDSTDDAEVAGDGLGTTYIDYVEFDYGDGNKSGRVPWTRDEQNASHAYANAGDFNLTLNVTDAVGHWKNTTVVVHVNDTTAPTISFTVKNATGGTNLLENKTIVFDANLTTDNLNNVSQMHFSWYFGDGTWLNGTGAEGMLNVTHNYTRIGAVTVSLNVTDLGGNYLKTPKVIQIASGPRPNMRIDRVYYEPGNFTEGEKGYIIVNMTNTGSAAASNVMLYIYQVNADGSQKLLTTWNTFLNGSSTVTVVEVGGKAQAKIPWTFDNKGTYTFKLNVTSQDQLSQNKYTASGDLALHVKEVGWKKLLLWGGVAAVIILVPLAIFLSRRWSKREKKGLRREKKVVKEKDEDL
ncbi:MAG: PKD domain-containing protein [Candidatus Thermoplasmatota archaeon]|nr:PKD domain-containing protein [Candidatus Thermoplasmatota archaeon]MBU1914176.1 PKD domain-containing protein [Candidatus Thermoplasmatota archaeon]